MPVVAGIKQRGCHQGIGGSSECVVRCGRRFEGILIGLQGRALRVALAPLCLVLALGQLADQPAADVLLDDAAANLA